MPAPSGPAVRSGGGRAGGTAGTGRPSRWSYSQRVHVEVLDGWTATATLVATGFFDAGFGRFLVSPGFGGAAALVGGGRGVRRGP